MLVWGCAGGGAQARREGAPLEPPLGRLLVEVQGNRALSEMFDFRATAALRDGTGAALLDPEQV